MNLVELLKKKRVLFPLITIAQFTILTIIANIFGLGTVNTVYAAISLYIMYGTFVLFLFKILKDHRTKLDSIRIPLYGFPITWVIYFAIFVILTLLILFFFFMLFGVIPLEPSRLPQDYPLLEQRLGFVLFDYNVVFGIPGIGSLNYSLNTLSPRLSDNQSSFHNVNATHGERRRRPAGVQQFVGGSRNVWFIPGRMYLRPGGLR